MTKTEEQIEFAGEALGDDSPGGFDDLFWAEGEMVTVVGAEHSLTHGSG